MRIWHLGLCAAVAASAGTAQTPQPPAAKWVVNFDDAQCVAHRAYGQGDEPTYLVIKQPPLGDVIQLAVIQRRPAGEPLQVQGSIAFDGQAPMDVTMLQFQPKGSKRRTYTTNLPSSSLEALRSARSVRIKTTGLDGHFQLADVEPLLRVMNDCVADLRRVWNVSEDGAEPPAGQGPQAHMAGMFKGDDYPMSAVIGNAQGSVSVVLLVDENGKVADCSVIGTSRAAALDGQTCAILRERAKFTPAVGSDGKPTRGAFTQRITWRIDG